MVSQSTLGTGGTKQEDPSPWVIPEAPKTQPRRMRPSWIALSLLFVAAAAAEAGVVLLRSQTNGRFAPVAFVIAGFFFVAAVAAQVVAAREHRIEADEDSECEQDCDVLRQALNRISDSDSTLKGLADVNFRQMRVFTVIAQRQARMSYYASLTAAAISLLVLLTGVTAAYGLTGTPAKITVASLAAAGSALSGFLSATFLKTYAMASRQMSYYYGQPLVHCYLLHAQWLASIADEHIHKQQIGHDPWNEVIKASIQASANAQEHLLSLQEAGFAKSRRRNSTAPAHNGSRKNHERALNGNKAVGAAQSEALKFNLLASPPAAQQPQPAQEDTAATLRKLADLHREGMLTDEEYSAKRAEVIARI
jgi:hypothetical protein